MAEAKEFRKVLVIGAGAAVIGQGQVYERAGLQVCQALRGAGIQTVVLNNDPASLLTESEWADRIYCEPVTAEVIAKISALERPEGLIITCGGQNALNLGYSLAAAGFFGKHPIKLLGFTGDLLFRTEDRSLFAEFMNRNGFKTPAVSVVKELRDSIHLGKTLGFPLVVRTPLAAEGLGVNLAFNQEELAGLVAKGLAVSPLHTIWLEESLLGWREYEVEALRDSAGQCLVTAVLENVDPVGVHSGDSIIVTPPQGLSDQESDELGKLTAQVLTALELVGAANLQWARHPENGEIRLIRVNPRFTHSTALAVQATGMPLAALSVRLMLGHTLADVAGFEGLPEDYARAREYGQFHQPTHSVTVRLPRFDLARFPEANPVLTTTMKATGEVAATGGNFGEALQKAVRSLENGYHGLGADRPDPDETELSPAALKSGIFNPVPERLWNLRLGLKRGMNRGALAKSAMLPEWFIREIAQLIQFEKKLATYALYNLDPEVLRQAKRAGFSDRQIAYLLRSTPEELRQIRIRTGIRPVYRKTTAAFYYSTYDGSAGEITSEPRNGVLLIGSGPSRIGQGGEYDYCAAKAACMLQETGYPCIYVNCNPASAVADFVPEVLSYGEPLTAEDLWNICEREKPTQIITQFSGADRRAGLRHPDYPFEAEMPDMEQMMTTDQWQTLLATEGITRPGCGEASNLAEANQVANRIGFPVALSPADTGSGCALAAVAHVTGELAEMWERLLKWCHPPFRVEHLPDQAVGIQLNGVADGKELCAAAAVEQIEEALVHLGDSACAFPVYTLPKETLVKLTDMMGRLVRQYQIKGLLSVLFAVKHNLLYLREIKTGDCRMIPFIQKITGCDWVKMTVQALLGLPVQAYSASLPQLNAVREAVFGFENFPGVDTILGPEQRSTGAVCGIDPDFGLAFIKSQLGAGETLPATGNIYLSVRDEDKRDFAALAKQLTEMGFRILADLEMAEVLGRNQVTCQEVPRLGEGRPDILDRMKNGEVHWIINTPAGRKARREEALIRSTAVARGIPITTTLSGARAAVSGLERYLRLGLAVKPVTEYPK